MRSVEGTTQAAKAASLERGVQAAFAIATADRAAAMLKVHYPPCNCDNLHLRCHGIAAMLRVPLRKPCGS